MRHLVFFCAAAIASAQQPGLLLTLRDARHQVRLSVPTANFHLEAGESLHAAVEPSFNAEWSGTISILQAAEYAFDAGKAELQIDGSVVVRPIHLTSGQHAFAVRFRRSAGVASLQLKWKTTQFDWEPVPSTAFQHQAPPAGSSDGRRLVRELGCANCHAAKGLERPGPVLTGTGGRTTQAWIHEWLRQPQAFRAGARMPVMLNSGQRADAAAYLASLKPDAAARARPRRVNEVIIGKGNELFGTIGCIACHQQAGLELKGLGSKYTIDSLTEFLKDPSKVEPAGYMPSMLLNEDDALALAAHLMQSRGATYETNPPPGDPQRGRVVLETAGCLACHSLESAVNRRQAKPLAQLQAAGGCLAENPIDGLPRYAITPEERTIIAGFLAEFSRHPNQSPAPVFTLRENLREFRCIACHKTESQAPLATLAEAVPVLTGAGQKLRTHWIDQVLTGKQRIHSQHEVRMPHYTAEQVQGWAAAFAKSEGLAPGDGPPAPAFPESHGSEGIGLIGTNPRKRGMGCIGCHDWGENKSLGEEGPQLANLTSRLRFDWYQRWMLNPARILSGTSMPNYFTSTPRPRAGHTIGLLWAAMEAGRKLPIPDGIHAAESAEAGESKPVPGKQAIVIRWDMPEATPAAIAVGLPGKLSYCFDAGDSRLLYAWQGGFLDMTGTLFRKTDEKKLTPTAALIGEIFWRSGAFPIRTGTRDHIPQRRFRGYRFVSGMPEFHYTVDGVDVFERITAAPGQQSLRRTLRFPKVDQPIWFDDREVPRGTDITVQSTLAKGGAQ